MEIMKFDKSGDPLSIEVEIKGPPVWSFDYVGKGCAAHNTSELDAPKHHILGAASEFDMGQHDWDFRLANTSNQKEDCTVSITWYQGEKKIGKKWTKPKSLKASEADVLSGSIFIFGI